jgi:hypothetical protein
MNFINTKKDIIYYVNTLNITHFCGGRVTFDVKKDYSICNKCNSKNDIELYEYGVYLNVKITNDSYVGIILQDSDGPDLNDIIVDLDIFIQIIKLQDFNKYLEKYETLVLFK